MSDVTRSPDEIERTSNRNRAEVISTLDQLKERLSLEAVAADVTEYMRGAGGRRLYRAASDNPLAALITIAGIVWLLYTASRSTGQDAFDGGNSMSQNNGSHENVLASNVTGTNVYNTQGDHLGHVEDFVVGKRDGRVKYAILSIGGFLGIGEEYHPIPWAELEYSERQDGFVINRSREQLTSAPRYTKNSEPDWSDHAYGETVYGYYGIPYI